MSEKRYPLVVIGAGGGGLTAACRAAEMGVSPVLVLEKRPYHGGNSGMAGGWIFGVESDILKASGSTKTCEQVFNEAMNYHHYERIDMELLWKLIRRSAFTMEWMTGLGAQYRADGPDCHMPAKLDRDFGYFRTYIDKMLDRLLSLGGELRTNAAVTRIVTEEGAVQAVEYTDGDGAPVTVPCDAVVLSTGGFCGNDELLQKYFPEQYEPGTYLTDAIPMDGDGIGLARDAGARLNDYCTLLKEPNYSFMRRNSVPNRIGGITFSVWVNRDGRRYCAEDGPPGNGITNILVQQPGKVGYALFDSRMIDDIVTGRRDFPMAAMIDRATVRDCLQSESRQWVCISEDWDGIAAWIGAKPETLRATVEEYNAACAAGEDDRFGKRAENLLPLAEGPFYAVKFCPLLIDTFGPVVTDSSMRVLGTDGAPIRGMYAAGVITAGWQGRDYYLRGAALGLTLTSGLLAGETCARDRKQSGKA